MLEYALRPPALRRGDVIGIAAPASAFKAEPFERGVGWLREQGFTVRYAPRLFESHHYLAGRAEDRLADLYALAEDPEVKAVFAARGGFGAMHLLPGLDARRLTAQPKIWVGYSDLTVLLGAIRDGGGLACYHGPVMTGLMDASDDLSRAHLLASLTDWRSPPPPLTGGRALTGGSAVGEAVGGNLSLIAATMGTPYQLKTRGRILLLEEVGERPYRIDRLLTQLALGGMFDGVAGIAVGGMVGCEEPGGRGRPIDDLLAEHLGGRGVPVCLGLPFGHGPQNRLIPLGLPCRLDADVGRLSFPEPVVAPPASFGAS